MEIAFKGAENSDIDMLVTFVREYYEYDHHLFDEGIVRTGLAEFLSDETLGRLWVIRADAEAVGYMALMRGYRLAHNYDAFLDEIYVRPNYRSQGIGRRALAFVEEVCRELEVKALHLEVERENTKARALYTTVGYVDYDHYLMTCWVDSSQPQTVTPSSEITFKSAQNSDIEILVNLTQGAAEANSRVTLARLVTNASLGRVWLIEADREPVGYVVVTFSYSLEFHGRDALLDKLYLRDSYRQEYSVPSLKFAQAQCRLLEVNALHVEMERDNPPAQALYRAAGFEDEDSYLMTKWLA
ncbi:MAG: GNAT family N-acetyltransferase [Chloroflexi bacterium]|nr:GNAT family N-acetyltransferase [Chloroflexota bacterium]